MAEDTDIGGGTRTLTRPRGGGSPGKAAGGGKPPSSGVDSPKSPAESGLVLRNGKNPLALPVTRLKVGWYNPMPADLARFRIWIPTKTGGVLTIQYKTGTVDLTKAV